MWLLELCSGSCVLSREAEALGWSCTRLDLDLRTRPDLCMDLRDFDENAYPRDHFDWVHASPPCTEYAMCMTRRPRNFELADSISQAALRILE